MDSVSLLKLRIDLLLVVAGVFTIAGSKRLFYRTLFVLFRGVLMAERSLT